MNITRKLGFLTLLCLLGFLAPVHAADSTAAAGGSKKTVRLLTVGNSFSQNTTAYLDKIATAAGKQLIHHRAVIGGSTFAQHLEKAQLHEKDPKDAKGLYSTKRSLKQELTAERWDVITIQQASIKSHDIATYRPSARDLYDYIKRYAPNSEVVMHQTWEYRCDDPRFSATNEKPGEPKSQDEMYRSLTAAYKTIAAELGVRRIPTGDAFHIADTDPTWGFKPDKTFVIKGAKEPALPDQTHSLHVGWRWKKDKSGKLALGMDGHHANLAGEYLGGCVWFEFLYGESVVGNKFVPKGLDAEYAKFLQETAHKAVANMRAEAAAK